MSQELSELELPDGRRIGYDDIDRETGRDDPDVSDTNRGGPSIGAHAERSYPAYLSFSSPRIEYTFPWLPALFAAPPE